MSDQMQQSTCLEITLQQIIQTMAMGLPAEQTVPGDKGIWLAGDLIQQVKEITAQDVERVTTEKADPVLQDYLDAHQTGKVLLTMKWDRPQEHHLAVK